MTPDNNYSQNIVNLHNEKKIKVDIKKTVIGFILYFIIFVILIPLILFKSQMYGILEAYMPNVDLIATVISWHGGPLKMKKPVDNTHVVNNIAFPLLKSVFSIAC